MCCRSPAKSGTEVRVWAHPTSTSFALARVMATLMRRQSVSSRPASPLTLARTSDTMTHSLSRPWYLSMVSDSMSSKPPCCLANFATRATCARYGEMAPMLPAGSPHAASAAAMRTTRAASPGLATASATLRRSIMEGHPPVSTNTACLSGTTTCCSQRGRLARGMAGRARRRRATAGEAAVRAPPYTAALASAIMGAAMRY
mmetsp:Transcript_13975/g.42160  ORF Transcript_13975/g.42160 Transcript_13975/m.42160 type:complete len:202 (+) Transcript_13975:1206-1811(+)